MELELVESELILNHFCKEKQLAKKLGFAGFQTDLSDRENAQKFWKMLTLVQNVLQKKWKIFFNITLGIINGKTSVIVAQQNYFH